MNLESEFHAELIDRFLKQLDYFERLALGDEPDIQISFVEGKFDDPLIISPVAPILHVKAASKEHQYALELSAERFIKAAEAVGFTHLFLGQNEKISYAFRCKPRRQNSTTNGED